jgi:hypothetical protein
MANWIGIGIKVKLGVYVKCELPYLYLVSCLSFLSKVPVLSYTHSRPPHPQSARQTPPTHERPTYLPHPVLHYTTLTTYDYAPAATETERRRDIGAGQLSFVITELLCVIDTALF